MKRSRLPVPPLKLAPQRTGGDTQLAGRSGRGHGFELQPHSPTLERVDQVIGKGVEERGGYLESISESQWTGLGPRRRDRSDLGDRDTAPAEHDDLALRPRSTILADDRGAPTPSPADGRRLRRAHRVRAARRRPGGAARRRHRRHERAGPRPRPLTVWVRRLLESAYGPDSTYATTGQRLAWLLKIDQTSLKDQIGRVIEVSVSEAKTQLSRLLERVRAGEEVLILKSGKPYARLVAPSPRAPRAPGLLAGGPVDDAFFDPLPEAELEAWEG